MNERSSWVQPYNQIIAPFTGEPFRLSWCYLTHDAHVPIVATLATGTIALWSIPGEWTRGRGWDSLLKLEYFPHRQQQHQCPLNPYERDWLMGELQGETMRGLSSRCGEEHPGPRARTKAKAVRRKTPTQLWIYGKYTAYASIHRSLLIRKL